MRVKYCKKCNHELDNNAKFCINCGEKQEVSANPISPPVRAVSQQAEAPIAQPTGTDATQSKPCEKCGHSLPKHMGFCNKCGQKQAASVSNVARPPVTEKPPVVPVSGVTMPESPSQERASLATEQIPRSRTTSAPNYEEFLRAHGLDEEPKKKSTRKANFIFFGVLFAIAAAVLISYFAYLQIQNAQQARNRDALLGPTIAAVVSSWNTEADRAPNGPTHGVSISEDEISSMEEITLSDGVTVRFAVSSNRVGSVYYHAPNLLHEDYEQALSGIVQAVFPMDSGNLSAINQNLNEAIEAVSISEAVTGFILTRSASRISVNVFYPYKRQLELSNQATGLSFGLSLAEYAREFSRIYHQAAGGRTFRTSGVSNDDFINAAQTAVYNYLRSPSTAVWGDANVIERDTYGRAIVSVTVDAQNAFGATVRNYLLVVIQGFTSDTHFTYNTANGVHSFRSRIELESGVDLMKIANFFGQPRHADALEESDFEAHGQIDGYSIYHREDFFTVFVYMDDSERISAISLTAPVAALEDEDFERLLQVYVATLIGASTSEAREILHDVFDFPTQTPTEHIYQNGIFYQSYIEDGFVTFLVAAVRTSQYENGIMFPTQAEIAESVADDADVAESPEQQPEQQAQVEDVTVAEPEPAEPSEYVLIGTWVCLDDTIPHEWMCRLTFDENGRFVDNDGDWGSFFIDGNFLTLAFDEFYTITFTFHTHGSQLTLTSPDIHIVLTRQTAG
jgi:hypothetical protein